MLILRHSGLSYKEIAAVMDIAASSVGTLLSRAEKKFETLYRQGEKDAPKG
jgi:DNA-directed RNA polymerase specialized sigma24 family protein